jgi:hypothetical protein
MTRATVLQEVRRMRFEELSARRQRRELTTAEAAEILGATERTFRRWIVRYEADGAEGLEDRRLGQTSARAVPVDEVLQMVTLYETRYTGWTVKHFHERGKWTMAGHAPTPGRSSGGKPRARSSAHLGGARIARNGPASPCRG